MPDFFKHWFGSGALTAKIVSAIFAVVITIVVTRLLQRLLGRKVHDTPNRQPVRNFIGLAGLVVAIFIITNIFGEKLGQFSLALSVLGAGIAFALQEVIVSVAGWLAILFAGFYKTGDRVQLGGTRGDVIEIGILRTTLMEIGEWIKGDLYTGRVVRIANSFVFKEAVFNYTGAFPYIWDELSVPIRYDSDARLARSIIEDTIRDAVRDYTKQGEKAWRELLAKYDVQVDANVEPMVTMTATDNWTEYAVRYVVDYKQRRIIKDAFFTRLIGEINKTEGKVGIASSTFQVVAPSVLDVNVRQAQNGQG
jgi:small-conductance mechanosensitive channel